MLGLLSFKNIVQVDIVDTNFAGKYLIETYLYWDICHKYLCKDFIDFSNKRIAGVSINDSTILGSL